MPKKTPHRWLRLCSQSHPKSPGGTSRSREKGRSRACAQEDPSQETSAASREPQQDLQHFSIAGSGHHEAEGVLPQLHIVVEACGGGAREGLNVLVRNLKPLRVGVSDLHTFTQQKRWAFRNSPLTQTFPSVIPSSDSDFHPYPQSPLLLLLLFTSKINYSM